MEEQKLGLLEISPKIKQSRPKFPENIEYTKPDNAIIKRFQNERYINDLFDNMTMENLEDKEITDLKETRYNSNKGDMEEINTLEFEFINNVLKNGEQIVMEGDFKETNSGKIIMYGYFRFLNLANYIELELNELFNKYKIGEWVGISNNLIIGLQDFKDKYEPIIQNRFEYYCTLVCYSNEGKQAIIPVYKDKNEDLYIPTYRRIVKNYLTLFNISKKISFLEFNKSTGIFSFYFGERFNIMKYDIVKNRINYCEFPSYYNEESIEEINKLENKV